MSNPTIQLESKLSAKDYVKANRSMLFSTKGFIILIILSIISLSFSIFYLFNNKLNEAGLFLILPVVFALVYFVIIPYRIKSFYNKSRKLHDKIKWVIDENGFIMETNDIREKYVWNEFQSIKKTGDFYLLVLKASKKTAKIIPIKAFKYDDEFRIFGQIMEANTIKRSK